MDKGHSSIYIHMKYEIFFPKMWLAGWSSRFLSGLATLLLRYGVHGGGAPLGYSEFKAPKHVILLRSSIVYPTDICMCGFLSAPCKVSRGWVARSLCGLCLALGGTRCG